MSDTKPHNRQVDLGAVSFFVLAAVGLTILAAFLRLWQLAEHALSWDEAKLSFESFRFFRGAPALPIDPDQQTTPVLTLSQGLSFFLFGVTDVTARLPMVIAGIMMVILTLALRPFSGSSRAAGAAALVALSPTVLYASRTVNSEVLVAVYSLLAVVLLLRSGQAGQTDKRKRVLVAFAGVSLAAMFGSSPVSISVFLALIAGCGAAWIGESPVNGAIRSTVGSFRADRTLLPVTLASFGIATVVLFSRFFTDIAALGGIGESVADWVRLIGGQASNTPTQFFLMAVVLYAILALIFAFYEAYKANEQQPGELSWLFFLGWFVTALLLFSFSSGRTPEQAVLVILPLLIWGGMGAGRLLAGLYRKTSFGGLTTLLVLAIAGLFAAVAVFFIQAGSVRDAADQSKALLTIFGVILLAIVPLAVAVYVLAKQLHNKEPWFTPWNALLAAVLLLLAIFSWRAAVQLTFYRADEGTELLAQQTSTVAVGAFVDRIEKLSRDLTVSQGSAQDPTGGHGLSIAIDQGVQWPMRWYFREYPNLSIVGDGEAAASGAQLILVSDDAGIEASGYSPRAYPVRNRVPPAYAQPDMGSILMGIIDPRRWDESMDYVLFRQLDELPAPEIITAGYGPELSQQLYPSSGPYALSESPGAGSGRGQFEEPRDLAIFWDTATLFVVDMGNGRVQQFDGSGQFAGAWGDEGDDIRFEVTDAGLGPTGIAMGADGSVFVADTWNHTVKVLDQSGRLVREFGANGDNQDSADPMINPGLFFGPRDLVVVNDEIYVVDTGNERVQVFALDGSFLRAFGGTGSEPGQLREPVGIAAGPDGNLYVADSSNARISVFAPDGTPVLQFPVAAWQGMLYFEPYLVFDTAGRLYASSSATSSIEVFDLGGQPLESIRFSGDTPLLRPYGLALGADGLIYVSDAGLPGVVTIEPGSVNVSDEKEVVDELSPATPVDDQVELEPTSTAAG